MNEIEKKTLPLKDQEIHHGKEKKNHMKIYSALPEGNEMASLEPARYFNLGIEQVEQILDWMKDAKGATQPLLVHLNILLVLSEKYPSVAEDRIYKLDLENIKTTFLAWYERNSSQIPTKYREDIKESGIQLIEGLKKYWKP